VNEGRFALAGSLIEESRSACRVAGMRVTRSTLDPGDELRPIAVHRRRPSHRLSSLTRVLPGLFTLPWTPSIIIVIVIELLRSLFHYQAWADAAILEALQAHPQSLHDEWLFKTLHHIVTAQRIILSRCLARPIDTPKESPASFDELVQIFRATHEEELAFVEGLANADLERRFEISALGFHPTVVEGLTHVVLHSQNHRGQCLIRLRENGAKPPTLDYILWAKTRPVPCWPASPLPNPSA
jgi:uncharacterized damage-inducible protein DinB